MTTHVRSSIYNTHPTRLSWNLLKKKKKKKKKPFLKWNNITLILGCFDHVFGVLHIFDRSCLKLSYILCIPMLFVSLKQIWTDKTSYKIKNMTPKQSLLEKNCNWLRPRPIVSMIYCVRFSVRQLTRRQKARAMEICCVSFLCVLFIQRTLSVRFLSVSQIRIKLFLMLVFHFCGFPRG